MSNNEFCLASMGIQLREFLSPFHCTWDMNKDHREVTITHRILDP